MTNPQPTCSMAEAPIPSGAQAVLELFDTELAELKFPDVDQAVLSEATARVLGEASALAAAEAAVAMAREALIDAQEALLGKCQRALAYARIYAEEDRNLSRKLEAISLSRLRAKAAPAGTSPGEAEAPKSGRRGKRSPPASGPLFLDPAAGPGSSSPPAEAEAQVVDVHSRAA